MEGKPRNLIETVACDIATNILQDYREVKGLKISVQKPHVALDGVVKSMGEASMLEGGSQGTVSSRDCLLDALFISGCAQACRGGYKRSTSQLEGGCAVHGHSPGGKLSLASLRRCGDREVPL